MSCKHSKSLCQSSLCCKERKKIGQTSNHPDEHSDYHSPPSPDYLCLMQLYMVKPCLNPLQTSFRLGWWDIWVLCLPCLSYKLLISYQMLCSTEALWYLASPSLLLCQGNQPGHQGRQQRWGHWGCVSGGMAGRFLQTLEAVGVGSSKRIYLWWKCRHISF